MSQASGIIPPRARFFGTSGSAAPSKRQLGIETLEHRCPMDASAAMSGLDVETWIGGGAASGTQASVPAITSTLHDSHSQGPDQRAIPPQPNPAPSQAQASTKATTAMRRAAMAKRSPAVDSLQTPARHDAGVPQDSGTVAENVGHESSAPDPSATSPSDHRDEAQGQSVADQPTELTLGSAKLPHDPTDSGVSGLDNSLDDSGSSGESRKKTDDQTPGAQLNPSLDPPISSPDEGDEGDFADPWAGTEPAPPYSEFDVECPPAAKPAPISFVMPPGPAGSIGLSSSGRDSTDYWATGSKARAAFEDEPEIGAGTAAIRQPRQVRGDSAAPRARYYDSLTAADEPPVDSFRSRSTPLRDFARRLEPFEGGIAIGSRNQTPADYAAYKQERSRSLPAGSVAPSEADEASHANQTDLAISALVEEDIQAEQIATEAVESGMLITTVSLAMQEPCESNPTCGRESCEEAIVATLAPSQEFMISLSRWAALGLLVSHRISHRIAGRGGAMSWCSAVRARLTGRRSRNS